MLKETIVSINQRGNATSTWEINTCIQKWSSNMNRMIKSTWEMHATSPIAQVKYFQVRKEKVGIKLIFYCI